MYLMTKRIFAISLIIALILQYLRWSNLPYVLDGQMWADQARYVQTNNPNQFNFLAAYGHPGATVIDGVILIHTLGRTSYSVSMVIFLTLFNALLIAAICTLCFKLYPKNLWWLGTLIMFSSNVLFASATPPSAVVSLLIVLLALISLYIYQSGIVNPIWAILAGLAVATRADIGSISALAFWVFLKLKLGWKKIFSLGLGAGLTFIIVDTYMWYMPIQHLKDLIHKMTFHYADYTVIHLAFPELVQISDIALISIFLTFGFIFLKKKLKFPLPTSFAVICGILTIICSTIFLTARSQAPRYFMPLIFIWELIFPLLILTLISKVKQSAKHPLPALFLILLAGYQIFLLVESLT